MEVWNASLLKNIPMAGVMMMMVVESFVKAISCDAHHCHIHKTVHDHTEETLPVGKELFNHRIKTIIQYNFVLICSSSSLKGSTW